MIYDQIKDPACAKLIASLTAGGFGLQIEDKEEQISELIGKLVSEEKFRRAMNSQTKVSSFMSN